jgi:hypothetical protein
MQFKDGLEPSYELYVAVNSKDPLAKRIVDFGTKWAEAMEKDMASGIPLETCFAGAARNVNKEFHLPKGEAMLAMAALTNFWKYGRELHDVFAAAEARNANQEKPQDKGEISL